MEREIMKAIVVHDIDMLRAIFIDATKGNVYVAPELLYMVGEHIKRN